MVTDVTAYKPTANQRVFDELGSQSINPVRRADFAVISRWGFAAWLVAERIMPQPQPIAAMSELTCRFIYGEVAQALRIPIEQATLAERCGRVFLVNVQPVSRRDPPVPFMFAPPYDAIAPLNRLYAAIGSALQKQTTFDFTGREVIQSAIGMEREELAYFIINLRYLAALCHKEERLPVAWG